MLYPGPELIYTLLLALTTLGVVRVVGAGGVLAVFVAGLPYNRLVAGERAGQDNLDEAVNRYAVIPLFVVPGTVLPWEQWCALGPATLGFVTVVLLLRRAPFVLPVAGVLRLRVRDSLFTGWLGPIGLCAVFYLAHSRHTDVTDPRMFAAGTGHTWRTSERTASTTASGRSAGTM